MRLLEGALPLVGALLLAALGAVSGDSELESLDVEHRSAKAEPFLDRIASLFTGGGEKKADHPPPGPIYRQPKPPPRLQGASSLQRPVAVSPPKKFYPPSPASPPRQSASSSNLSPVSQPATFGALSSGPSDPWQISQPANMPQIKDLQVQCEKDLMRVRILFDRPFYGMVFSKGHYSNVNCVHVPSGLGQTQATFDIAMGQCGMSTGGNSEPYNGAPTPQGSFIENTIIVQYDPLLQEVWDQARKMRCTWYDFYEKAVTFKPYQVDMLDPVTANFLGDNLRCWMQIQVGKGPYASEVSGIVKIGQTMTMVLGVKDDENKFDMMVRNCVAHDGLRAPIQLVDERGCVVRDKIMSPFKKLKNFDSTANVLAYAYFQAFKFPDSMNVHFQCVVQVCRGACPEPNCGGGRVPLDQDSYGAPDSPSIDSYGAPAGPSVDSYGSPGAPVIDSYGSPGGASLSSYNGPSNRVDPRIPNLGQYTSGSERRVSVVRPEGGPNPSPIPLKQEGGYNGFNKRMGVDTNAVGGNPRSLDFEAGEEVAAVSPGQAAAKTSDEDQAAAGNSVDEVHSRRRRTPVDGNGNRILRMVRREAEAEAEEEAEDVNEADIETSRVIRVVSPSDVQFQLNGAGEEEVVINTNSVPTESLCIDTAAFVGVTITFIMLLVVAIITIVFLWMRIRAIDRKNLL